MPQTRDKTVVILGASRFTGRHLVQKLLRDHRYRLLTPGREICRWETVPVPANDYGC